MWSVNLLYFTRKYIAYFIKINKENSSNIFLITVNEKLYFKITFPTFSLENYIVSIAEGYIVLMPIPQTY